MASAAKGMARVATALSAREMTSQASNRRKLRLWRARRGNLIASMIWRFAPARASLLSWRSGGDTADTRAIWGAAARPPRDAGAMLLLQRQQGAHAVPASEPQARHRASMEGRDRRGLCR